MTQSPGEPQFRDHPIESITRWELAGEPPFFQFEPDLPPGPPDPVPGVAQVLVDGVIRAEIWVQLVLLQRPLGSDRSLYGVALRSTDDPGVLGEGLSGVVLRCPVRWPGSQAAPN